MIEATTSMLNSLQLKKSFQSHTKVESKSIQRQIIREIKREIQSQIKVKLKSNQSHTREKPKASQWKAKVYFLPSLFIMGKTIKLGTITKVLA